MDKTEVSKTVQEKVNFEILKQTLREKSFEASKVRNTGVMR